jgi:phosphoribosylanthranilate isomerase
MRATAVMNFMSLVKICGLSTIASIDCSIEAGADMLGLVFFPPSPRFVRAAEGAALRAHIGQRASSVALVVDAGDEELDALIPLVKPDFIQLHGRETPERANAIARRYGRPIIKALGISSPADVLATKAYEPICDWLLLDAKPPKGAALPGGNGLAFDWTVLEGFVSAKPWLLSGGLTPDNVALAIKQTNAPAVDVSSGVERQAGVKDLDLIRSFIAKAKGQQLPLGNQPKTA